MCAGITVGACKCPDNRERRTVVVCAYLDRGPNAFPTIFSIKNISIIIIFLPARGFVLSSWPGPPRISVLSVFIYRILKTQIQYTAPTPPLHPPPPDNLHDIFTQNATERPHFYRTRDRRRPIPSTEISRVSGVALRDNNATTRERPKKKWKKNSNGESRGKHFLAAKTLSSKVIRKTDNCLVFFFFSF